MREAFMPTMKSGSKRAASPRQRGKRIRYAVVGLGHIAQVAILPAFAHAKQNSELKALVTDDPKKAKQLSKKYRVPFTYGYESYDECLQSGEIDAVYIALPNSMHHEYAVPALKAGIHVLCEKPLAIDAGECEDMINAAAESGAKLMTAYRLHFDKANLEAVEIVRSGKLGNPRFFSSTFGMQVRPDNIRLSHALGGGPLWDLGVYCVNAARYLFRDEPEEVFAFEATGNDARFREVEESVSAIMRFPEARLASFTCSFGSGDVSAYEVAGTKGTLRADPAYEYAEGLKLTTTIEGKSREYKFGKSDQFAAELLYFSDCVLRNRRPEPSGKEGLADVRIIRSMYRSIETGKPIKIEAIQPKKRPTAEQEIRRPPVKKPALVRAKSAST
jgi:glucose-fructose oxidoreductase